MKRLLQLCFVLLLSAPLLAQYAVLHPYLATHSNAPGAESKYSIINLGVMFHTLQWNVSGSISACTVQVDQSNDGATWSTLIPSQTCTSNGITLPTYAIANYIRVNFTSFTGNGSVYAYYTGLRQSITNTVLSGVYADASAFFGVDWCSKVINAAASLNAAGGAVDARALVAGQSCASTLVSITKPVDLLVGASTINFTTNIVIPKNIHLQFSTGSLLSPSGGNTLTINGKWEAQYAQVFSGAGTIRFGWLPSVLDPVWWGAKYDQVTDDSGAINAAFAAILGANSFQLTSGRTVMLSGMAAISHHILIDRISAKFMGQGGGAIASTSPPSTGLIATGWQPGQAGVNGEPMVEVKNCIFDCWVGNMRMYGNTTNKPRAAVSFVRTSGGPIINRIIGLYTGSMSGDTGFTTDPSFFDGIRIGDTYDGGMQENNDTLIIESSAIHGNSNAAIRQGSIQNINIHIRNSYIGASTYGAIVSGSLNLDSVFFGVPGGAMFYVPSTNDFAQTPSVWIVGKDVEAEQSGRIIEIASGAAAALDITGGYFQTGANTAVDGKVIKADLPGAASIRLHHYRMTNDGTNPPYTFNVTTPVGSPGKKELIVDDLVLVNTAEPTLVVSPPGGGIGTTDQRVVCYSKAQLFGQIGTKACNYLVGSVDAYDATRYDIPNQALRIGDRGNLEGAIELRTTTRCNIPLTGLGNASVTAVCGSAIPSNALVLGVSSFFRGITFAGGAVRAQVGIAAGAAVGSQKWGTVAAAGNQAVSMTNMPSGLRYITSNITPAAVNAATCGEQAFAFTGVAVGDLAFVSDYPAPTAGTAIGAVRIGGAGSGRIMFCNPTAGPLTPAAGNYTLAVFTPTKFISPYVTTAAEDVIVSTDAGTFGAGQVDVAISYILLPAPKVF